MAKTLLRSGCLDDFQAVGDNGQPVFDSALQIRETLRLRQQPVLHCLAIPQRNEQGDYVDWYAPTTGKVQSWATADEAQRNAALQTLETALHSVRVLCEQCRQSTKTSVQLFGSLLEKALQFPGYNHVYLVDNQPVITFWGFININQPASSVDDPFACLRQHNHNSPPVSDSPQLAEPDAPLLPATEPLSAVAQQLRDAYSTEADPEPDDLTEATAVQHISAAEVSSGQENPGRRPVLFWLLPAAIMLIVIVAGVYLWRQQSATPVVAKIAITDETDETDETDKTDEITTDNKITTNDKTASDDKIAASEKVTGSDKITSSDKITTEMQTAPQASAADTMTTESSASVAEADTPALSQAKADTSSDEPETPPEQSQSASPAPEIPAQLAKRNLLVMDAIQVRDGITKFVDGNWQIDLASSDKGPQPKKISYKIWHNSGSADIILAGNVTCRVSLLSGLQQSGALMIKPRGTATCSNNTRYALPDIACRSGTNNVAQCVGQYNDNRQINVFISKATPQKKATPRPQPTNQEPVDSDAVNKEQR